MVEQKEKSSLSSQVIQPSSPGLDYLLVDLCYMTEKLYGSH